jgi:type I restriction enzyme S subunit
MEVRPGYKRTEVGVIPAKWETRTLGELTSLLTNGFVGKAKVHYVDSDDGILYIQGYNVKENGFNLSGIKRVSREFHQRNKKSHLLEGDLLTIQTGDIGVTAVVPQTLAGSNCHALVISRLIRDIAEPGFYCQFFNSRIGRGLLKEIETGSTMKHLNVGTMQHVLLPCPPLPEQRAIAEVLSDVDALIASLDRLIAKKRAIKQGAMQRLLTGQTRLPGFSGVWEVKQVGDLGSTFGGLTGKSKSDFEDGNAPYIPFLNVISNPVIDIDDLRWVKVSQGESQNRVELGDLFFNTSSETPEEVGMCSVILEKIPDLYLNSFCFGFRLYDATAADGLYLAYYFRSECGRKLMYALAQGATRYNLSKSNFLQLEFAMPPLPEQRAIAAVLSDMDTEIAALEARREKTRALKQGMMQELLTGKTRLI